MQEGIFVPDYKEMYLTLIRATEKAINILIEAQQKCEEQYLAEDESKPKLIDLKSTRDE